MRLITTPALAPQLGPADIAALTNQIISMPAACHGTWDDCECPTKLDP